MYLFYMDSKLHKHIIYLYCTNILFIYIAQTYYLFILHKHIIYLYCTNILFIYQFF
jgi:hypothetical protein